MEEESIRKIRSRSERILLIISHAVLIFMSFTAIVPFLLLISSSLTSEAELVRTGYSFWPKEWSIDAYRYVFVTNWKNIGRSYLITMMNTVIGTTLSLFITSLLGYVLSRRDYNKRAILSFFVFFTMLFNGGLVPTYISYTRIWHIKNTFAAYILPGMLMNAFNVMLMKSYFTMNIHPALIEAAKIDGASEGTIYRKIVMPLSLPILATIGLMIGINFWNDWQNPLYYITKQNMWSLQSLLNRILSSIQTLSQMADKMGGMTANMPSTSARMAIAVIGVLPILVLYPFFQKYFVKGISLGGVKE
ncbi:MAG: carbohydrate ABC transporter permease [Lachnospiraceae bacterium]|nr:carbohydrate ABC transporter permease [Lachnospiraceae bacterium]